MQCPRCEFENMPGMDRCFKCGSTLQIEQQDLDADPPRMAAWKKPFRDIVRTLRRLRILPGETPGIRKPTWLSEMFLEEILSVFLSIIPGLAHLLQRSFNTIGWYVAAWFVCLAATIFFYGSFAGYLFLGLCLVLHAWIAIHSRFIKKVTSSGHRIIAILFVSFLLWIVYSNIGRFIFQDIERIHSSITIPYHEIRINDYLLANRVDQSDHFLPRGSIVIAEMPQVTIGGHLRYNNRSSNAVATGQIIAFKNETVTTEENTFYVDGLPLEKDKYPVPMWLRGRALSITIPEDAYFIASEYNLNARGIALNNSIISEVCLIKTQGVESKVFMLWSSLTRRKFIRNYE